MSEVKLILGDCLVEMKKIPSKSVDLVLTDPPYNAGREYDNDNLEVSEYINFIDKFLGECFRVQKEGAHILITIGIKYYQPVFLALSRLFQYNWQFVLYKSNGMLNGKATFAKWDALLWFSKGEALPHNREDKGIFSGDVWHCPVVPSRNNFGHPTPKDLRIMMGGVRLFSNKNDTILDPFMGSGTTGVACKELGRNFIGIEINEKYFKIAERRINQATKELFV